MQLERLSLILEIVGQRGEATVGDICRHSGLPQATAYRLVQDLAAAGLLDNVARGRFAIGARLKGIVQDDLSDDALCGIIAPRLARAATEVGAAFFLSRLRGRSVEIIHVETPETGVSFLHPGLGTRPIHACSCSKALAAFAPDLLGGQAIEGRLKAYTDLTLTRMEDLQAEFAQIRSRGYAECVEELERGMCSVAAPLAQEGPGARLSIGATGSARVFTPVFRARIGQDLLGLAQELAAALGWDWSEPAPRPA
ncbi:transcriptional regulator, IclR family [Roseivivax lentus]|uniref:Transcriptional regulator, IclR family n=1 Tax=Roseivivax lentus TaxID=633194 RepID=A0A1N7LZT9_9RHOB|nr:IclR family transcriptional regulator C-terminal domain-containing protein [Roseivivax lentus]SIS79346.1 transcriptional regulator, IclR family [Roseivivax lentus]